MSDKQKMKEDMDRLLAYVRLCSQLTAAIGVLYVDANIDQNEFENEWWLSHLLGDLALAYDRIHDTDGKFIEAAVDLEGNLRDKFHRNAIECPRET